VKWFWETTIEPLLEAARARTILEVGVQQGATTVELIAFAERHGGVVHGIEPVPLPPALELEARHECFVLHRDVSLNVLPQLPALDAALIDGDHNWYTVMNELRLLAARQAELGHDFPLTFLHDVGWPYGRRDQYFDPDAIPEEYRHPFARGGLWPGREELHENSGVNANARHARTEGTPRNGVLTAVEDFVAAANGRLELTTLPWLNGIAIVVSRTRLDSEEGIRAHLRRLQSPEFLRSECLRLEEERNLLYARAERLRRELKAATDG
jgi:hypothetical protein